MKYADMNERQKRVFRAVLGAANWFVGGLEIEIENYDTESEEYKDAEKALADHDGLAEQIYDMVINGDAGTEAVAIADVRFCGKAWIKERIENRLAKMGY